MRAHSTLAGAHARFSFLGLMTLPDGRPLPCLTASFGEHPLLFLSFLMSADVDVYLQPKRRRRFKAESSIAITHQHPSTPEGVEIPLFESIIDVSKNEYDLFKRLLDESGFWLLTILGGAKRSFLVNYRTGAIVAHDESPASLEQALEQNQD